LTINDDQNEENMEMTATTSVEAMKMFAVLGDALGSKRDRKSLSERVMEMVAELHEQGFIIVPAPKGEGVADG
jgi:hypothetical protein